MGNCRCSRRNVPEWVDELARPESQKLADWLLELEDVEEPEFVTDEPEGGSVVDRLTDWWRKVMTRPFILILSQKLMNGEMVTGMLTGWLSELDESDEDELADDVDEEKAVTAC